MIGNEFIGFMPAYPGVAPVAEVPATDVDQSLVYLQDKVVKRVRRRGGHLLLRTVKLATKLIICLFACIGIVFSGVFVAMQYGLLNVKGSTQVRDEFYETLPKTDILAAVVPKKATTTSCVEQSSTGEAIAVCVWNKSSEWQTVRAGIVKDKDIILKVSKETGVPSRMIVAAVAPEQLRFFTSNREQFKRYFEPLKVLGSMTQFSLGIAGLKQKTAEQIEQYAVDQNSPFFAGKGMANLISYDTSGAEPANLYGRLTSKDHYYSYLYVALFIKELEAQWGSYGYDVTGRPDIVTTLYNIGFKYSHPKPDPNIGGTTIELNGSSFSYGELGTAFYRSDELTAIFPVQ